MSRAPEAPHSAPTDAGRDAVVALWCGLGVGAGIGAIDAIIGWRAAHQFLHGARLLQFVGFGAAIHALVIGSGALALPFAMALARRSAFAPMARGIVEMHRTARSGPPVPGSAAAFYPLAALLVGLGALALAASILFQFSVHSLADRKRHDLVVLIAMLAGAATLPLTATTCALLSPPLARLLHALTSSRPRLWRLLCGGPVVGAVVVLAVGAAMVSVAVLAQATAQEVPFRAMVSGTAAATLVSVGFFLARGQITFQASLLGAPMIAWGCALLATLGLGQHAGVIQAMAAHTGLGAPMVRALVQATDFDRDGYASWFGGLDCAPWNAGVSPAAYDIPGDGIDQNCVGGDAPASMPAAPQSRDATAAQAAIPTDLNILIITIDALPSDHVGSYGYARATTPNLDRLAAAGRRFANAWSHAPSTRFSIPVILSGQLPHQLAHQLADGVEPRTDAPLLGADTPTFATLAQRAGLATGAILSFSYFDRSRGLWRGFDTYDNDNRRLHVEPKPKPDAYLGGSSARQQADKAIAFLSAHRDQRFLLWTHFFDPHAPYQTHPEAPPWPGTIGRFDQEVFFTDQQIGRVLQALARQGVAERTAVIITSDHGESFGEHGIFRHGYHLYGTHTKVPLIVYVPGIAPGIDTAPASHIDIAPTIAQLLAPTTHAKTALPTAMTGASLLGPRDPTAMVPQELTAGRYLIRAIASSACHVIYSISPFPAWEAYDLASDPGEQHNLADAPGWCAAERQALGRYVDLAQRRAWAPNAADPPPAD